MIHAVSNSPGTPTPGNLPAPTPTAVEPTPKAYAGFSVPSAHFMPKMKLGGKEFPDFSTAPASPALASLAIDAQEGVPVSSAPTKLNSSEIGVRDRYRAVGVGIKSRGNPIDNEIR